MQSPLGEGPGDRAARADMDAYARIVAEFQPAHAIVLLRNRDQTPWSARPGLYDLNVILPPANDRTFRLSPRSDSAGYR